ncbi:odorant receptor 67d-like isoform X6 [Bactrocera dorsalis]|uniref:Odorant receptor n=1 Tax=Bactrocera dorsalis TaxID=27457 RepID=A0ABM3J582_BACDO|nr:odorant receptor 67d-like isoform X6 [Bactrocera dorsalis]XP_049304394.1 odorant receptor 67d-like isoform X6 [Bactrocera dorsalis]
MKTQKQPSDMYYKLLSVIRFCSRIIGVDITAEDYKINLNTYFVIAAIVGYYLCSIYMIGKYVLTDWTVLLDVFSPVSCTTQGVVKLISGLLYPKLYRKLAMDIGQIYEKYQQMGREYQQKLLEWNKSMKKILFACAIVYSITAMLILSTPIVMYVLKGEYHLILLCEVPGFGADSNYGYYVNNAFSLICVMIAAFGLYAGDLYLLLFLTHSIFFYDILVLKINDLHKLLEDEDKEDRQTKIVKDIVEWHQFYLEFNDKCNLLFFWTISAHIICTTLGILSTLLIIMLKDWPGAYTYLFVCFLWLYMYCILGTRVEICNDQFCTGVYDINWYALDVRNQNTIRLMLMQSQAPRNITIAGVEPLSVSTALKITRTIYSLVMMVLRFQNK